MSETPNNGIPWVEENVIDPAASLNLALGTIDALLQLAVLELGRNDPPATPADGDRYIVGDIPTGTWVGHENEIARYVADGDFWQFYSAWIALNLDDGRLYTFDGTEWATQGPTSTVGTTAERPASPGTGDQHFDTTLGQPIWWDGAGWVDATGTAV